MALEIFKLVGRIFVDSDAANKSISKTDDKAQGLGKRFLDGVGSAAKWGAGIAAAAGAAAAKLVDMAADAETAFAKVQTLLSTDTDMDAYYKSIMTASTETGVAFADFSEAVYSAISASVDAADAVEFTTSAVKLAKGGFTDTATAVDVLTTAINAYGLSAEDAEHISDVLIGTQNAGKTTVDELASSMGKVIPIANAANVPIEQLAAQYAVLTKNGIATAEAGTGLKAMLSELSKTGSKTDKMLREITEAAYGESMSFADLQREGFGIDEVLGMISGKAEESGLSLKDMFSSTEAATAAMTLFKDGGEDFNNILKDLANNTDVTNAAFDTMGGTFDEKMQIMKNAMDNVLIQIGESLMPVAQGLLDWVLEHMPEIQAVLEYVFGFVSDAAQTVGGWIEWLTGIFEQYMPVIRDVATKVFQKIVDFWNSDLHPMLEKLWEFIQDVLAPAFDWAFNHLILPAVEACFKGISDLWEGTLKPIFNGIIDFITGVFTGDWSMAWNGIVETLSGIFNGIISVIKIPLNEVIGIINSFIGGLNRLKIPDWVPGLGGKGINIPKIPLLEYGGVLERGQVGLLEGRGAEAVVPLENNRKWISAVAQDMRSVGIGGSDKSEQLLTELLRIVTAISRKELMLDTGQMVGALADPMDKALGRIRARAARA